MSDTPETDKLYDMVALREGVVDPRNDHSLNKWSYEAILDLVDFASSLERRISERDAEIARLKPWYNIVQDALVTNWCLSKENVNDPRKAINDLCCNSARLALDPLVSKAASELQDAYKERAEKAEAHLAVGVVVPRDKLEHWLEYWNGNANERAMSDALNHLLDEIGAMLAAHEKEQGK